jgi:1-phosphofructokinase
MGVIPIIGGKMIYTVTMNPALDYVLHADVTAGSVNNAEASGFISGGKGINVSKMLKKLGIPSIAFGFAAGFTGDEIVRQLRDLQTDFIRLPQGESRVNVKLKGVSETDINASGPYISPQDLAQLTQKLTGIRDDDTVVFAGSVPPSVPMDFYAKQIERLNCSCIVDASGERLKQSLKANPFLIKPNLQELQEICGKSLKNLYEVEQAAKEIHRLGAENVLVSMGENGAILVGEHTYYAAARKINAVNTTGAGDAMLAGFIAKFKEKGDKRCALEYAVDIATNYCQKEL